MKIKGEVIAVETMGESLRIDIQGKATSDAEWRPYSKMTFSVACIDKNARAFWIGRRVKVEITVAK